MSLYSLVVPTASNTKIIFSVSLIPADSSFITRGSESLGFKYMLAKHKRSYYRNHRAFLDTFGSTSAVKSVIELSDDSLLNWGIFFFSQVLIRASSNHLNCASVCAESLHSSVITVTLFYPFIIKCN